MAISRFAVVVLRLGIMIMMIGTVKLPRTEMIKAVCQSGVPQYPAIRKARRPRR